MTKLNVVNIVNKNLGLPKTTTLLGNITDVLQTIIDTVDERHAFNQHSATHWTNVRTKTFTKDLGTGVFRIPPSVIRVMTDRFGVIDGELVYNQNNNHNIANYIYNLSYAGLFYNPLESYDTISISVKEFIPIEKESLTYQYYLAYQASLDIAGTYLTVSETQLAMLQKTMGEWMERYYTEQNTYSNFTVDSFTNNMMSPTPRGFQY